MNCKEATHNLCEYLEGALGPSMTRKLERHLTHCANCQKVIAAARETIRVHFPSEPSRLFVPRPRTQTA